MILPTCPSIPTLLALRPRVRRPLARIEPPALVYALFLDLEPLSWEPRAAVAHPDAVLEAAALVLGLLAGARCAASAAAAGRPASVGTAAARGARVDAWELGVGTMGWVGVGAGTSGEAASVPFAVGHGDVVAVRHVGGWSERMGVSQCGFDGSDM